MSTSLDTVGQELYDDACAALEAGADGVAVMEQALDVICLLLRREEDRPLRERAVASLSDCLAELDKAGTLSDAARAHTLRDAARGAIRQVIAERPTAAKRPPPAPTHAPRRRAGDHS